MIPLAGIVVALGILLSLMLYDLFGQRETQCRQVRQNLARVRAILTDQKVIGYERHVAEEWHYEAMMACLRYCSQGSCNDW